MILTLLSLMLSQPVFGSQEGVQVRLTGSACKQGKHTAQLERGDSKEWIIRFNPPVMFKKISESCGITLTHQEAKPLKLVAVALRSAADSKGELRLEVFKPGKAAQVGGSELKLAPELEWAGTETLRVQAGRAPEEFVASRLVLEFSK